jgi:hypothetical protein
MLGMLQWEVNDVLDTQALSKQATQLNDLKGRVESLEKQTYASPRDEATLGIYRLPGLIRRFRNISIDRSPWCRSLPGKCSSVVFRKDHAAAGVFHGVLTNFGRFSAARPMERARLSLATLWANTLSM